MYEVQAGHIAAERSANPKIMELGRKMIADHGKAGDELKPIAVAKNLPAAALDQRHQGLIDNLRSATDQDLDRIYLQSKRLPTTRPRC